MPLSDLAEAVWYGEHVPAKLARALLSPASALYQAAVAQINMLAAMKRAVPGDIPALSIGNITVGGTGKTPVSAFFARRLLNAGATPALVLRGYGDDEVLVHQRLNPDVPVFVGADRVEQVRRASESGADVAVLDDAFQHRRAHRVADIVLVSADRWTGTVRLLPAGPFREPLRALRRASLVIVTVKSASDGVVNTTKQAVQDVTGSTVVTMDIRAASFVQVGSSQRDEALDTWRGRRVLAVSGIGDPGSFEAQLSALGLIVRSMSFPDHHSYDVASVVKIVEAARGVDAVVCTLKDAVKLEKLWPDVENPLWYLSQSVVPRDGTEALDDVVRSVLAARRITPSSPDLPR